MAGHAPGFQEVVAGAGPAGGAVSAVFAFCRSRVAAGALRIVPGTPARPGWHVTSRS